MLDEMSKAKYLVCGPFPVTGVAPGGFVDGSGIDNVGLLIDAGLLQPVVEPTVPTKKSTKPEQAGEEE
jgi:hypothetical protein